MTSKRKKQSFLCGPRVSGAFNGEADRAARTANRDVPEGTERINALDGIGE